MNNILLNENAKFCTLSERILSLRKKDKESEPILLPSIKNLKQIRVNSITNLKHSSPEKFKSYINTLLQRRMAKKSESKIIQNESDNYPYLNLQAKQVRYFEKDVRQNFISQSINQSSIQHLKTEASNNLNNFASRIPKLNFLLKKSESDFISKENYKRVKTLNQSDTSVTIEQQESSQIILLKLKQRNYFIRQTINNWIKKANQINRNIQS